MKKIALLILLLSLSLMQCDYSTNPLPKLETVDIYFSLPDPAFVQVMVQNIHGDRIKLISSGFLASGNYRFVWNGKNDNGQYVKEGLYFITISLPEFKKSFSQIIHYGKDD